MYFYNSYHRKNTNYISEIIYGKLAHEKKGKFLSRFTKAV